MPEDFQSEFEWPAMLRLPQVPPLKVPARRQTQFVARPVPVRYTEQVPVMPPLAPETDLFIPVPVTPPLTHQPQRWMHAPDPANHDDSSASSFLSDEKSHPYRLPQSWISSAAHAPVRRYIPTGRRSRDVGNGEFLLGCAFLIFMALMALGLLTWLSAAR